MAHELTISHDDKLCVNPLFSAVFGNSSRRDRPVYPCGSALEGEDYRDRFE